MRNRLIQVVVVVVVIIVIFSSLRSFLFVPPLFLIVHSKTDTNPDSNSAFIIYYSLISFLIYTYYLLLFINNICLKRYWTLTPEFIPEVTATEPRDKLENRECFCHGSQFLSGYFS